MAPSRDIPTNLVDVPPPLRRRPSAFERLGPTIRTTTSVVVGLVLWELIGRFVVTDRLFFEPLSNVLLALWNMGASGTLWKDLWVSGSEYLLGFALSAIVGVTLGVVLGANQRLYEYVDPWVSALYTTPLVALTPFFILVFGIGFESKVALVFALSVFPALINTVTGIRAVDRGYLEVARSFNLSRRQTFTKILIPAALPFIVGGLRLASGRALIGVVVGELFFSSAGVGHAIALAGQTFATAQLLAGVLIFAVSGIISTSLLRRLELRLAPWRTATS
jgi:NitT/TauT family transport system permease protein